MGKIEITVRKPQERFEGISTIRVKSSVRCVLDDIACKTHRSVCDVASILLKHAIEDLNCKGVKK